MPPADVVPVTPGVLRGRPLPDHGPESNKYDRGVVLVVGGSRETSGAVLLAGLGALRVGAGKLQLATAAGAASAMAIVAPEARVVGLPETADGALDPGGLDALTPLLDGAHAVVAGPGTADPEATAELLRHVVAHLGEAVLVVDAAAIPVLAGEPELLAPLSGRGLVMPNPGEMASLLRCEVDEVLAEPVAALTRAVEHLGTAVTLRNAQTWTAAPGSPAYWDSGGNAGLATSGSGDVLAGAFGGLAARGADPLTAAMWGAYLHGMAGDRCAARIGGVGYLARELLDELPAALRTLSG